MTLHQLLNLFVSAICQIKTYAKSPTTWDNSLALATGKQMAQAKQIPGNILMTLEMYIF
jgi:hypothetical protein